MRKMLSLVLAVFLMSSVSFGQYYASKQDAKNGKLSDAQEVVQVNSNRAMNAVFFSDNFDAGDLAQWTIFDEDGDGNNWANPGAMGRTGSCAQSESWNGSALTPDNWMASGAIDLSAAGASTLLDFWRKAQDQTWPEEVYSVYLSTSGNTVADFTGANGHVLIDHETVAADDWQKRSVSLADYAGQTVYIAFRHYDCTDMYRFNIDDVEIYENTTVDGGITAFLAPNNNTCSKTATENVTVTIFNYGGAALSNFEVSYSINGGAPVTETVTASIPAASSIDYTFTQTADLSTLGYYNFDCSLNITDDVNADNDTWSVKHIANGDDEMTIDVSTDNQGGQAWYVTNMVSGDTIAQHGAYQWDLTNDITTVCLNNADCYNFSWVGGTSNDVVVSHGGSVIDSRNATGDYQLFGIGSGCAADDFNFTEITTSSIVAIGNVNITGKVQNTGTANLTAFDVTYTIDGGAASATFTATCNVATGDFYEFTHNVAWDATAGEHVVAVTTSNANGNGNGGSTLSKNIKVINEIFPKTVVYEEGTGTWCGWCVRGLVGLNTMAHNITNGTWIGIGVHNADPMTVTAYDAAIGGFISGYPSGIMDRHAGEVDPGLSSLEPAYNEHLNMIPLAKIAVVDQSWDDASRAFTVEVATTFALDITNANYNTALIIVENDVTGVTSGSDTWDQSNYYDDGSNGAMEDWDGFNYVGAGDPVPAATMHYNHVGRQLVDGWAGTALAATDVTYNVPVTYSYSGTIPADNDETKTELVALVIDNATGQIVNATAVELDVTSIKQANNANFNIYPNPTTGIVKVEGVEGAQVIVYNMLGSVVYTEANASATTTIDLSSFNAGNYIVKVINNNEVATQKIVLTK